MGADTTLDAMAYDTVLATEKAAAVFIDPPYNVKIDGHVCGSGANSSFETSRVGSGTSLR